MPDESRRVPRRIVELTLPESWQAFKVTAWCNADAARRRRFGVPANDDELFASAGEIILSHTIADDDGPLPEPSSEDFFRRLPPGLYPSLQVTVLAQFGHLSAAEREQLESYYKARKYDRLRDADGPPPEKPHIAKTPWLLVRQMIAEEWRVSPWEVEAPELADELGRKLETMRLETRYL